jgi:hypothetical protein
MLDLNMARKLIAEQINFTYPVLGDSLVVLDECTIEKDYGWIFFYESKRWLDSGDLSDRVLGNVPILVDRQTGRLHFFGSDRSIEEYIEEYELTRHGS